MRKKRGYIDISDHWVYFLDNYLSHIDRWSIKAAKPVDNHAVIVCRNYFIAIALDIGTYLDEDLALLFDLKILTIHKIYSAYKSNPKIEEFELVENTCTNPSHIKKDILYGQNLC